MSTVSGWRFILVIFKSIKPLIDYVILASICRVQGECTNATFLAAIPGYGLSHCLKMCNTYDGCYYATFNDMKKICLLYETCSRAHVKTAPCPHCITSSIWCLESEASGECKLYLGCRATIIWYAPWTT